MHFRKFRETLGLPQRFLAQWLGTSRELLAQAETGKRDVPSQSMNIFFQLQQMLETLPDKDPELEKPYTDPKLVRKVRQKIMLLSNQIQLEENKITILKKTMSQQKKALLFCQMLETNSFFQEVLARKVLDLFLHKTRLNYERSGPRTLMKLEFYLKQKKDECAFLEEWIKEFE